MGGQNCEIPTPPLEKVGVLLLPEMFSPSDPADLERKLNEAAASTGLARVLPLPGLGYFAQPAPGTGGTPAVASVEGRCADSVPPSAAPPDQFAASGAGVPPASLEMKGNRDGRPASENQPSPPDDLSEQQKDVFRCVVEKEKKDVLVIAGPGSGKTKTLISCIIGAVEGGTPAGKLVAISFTNNSAAELKVRLCKAAIALPSLHRVHVSTFHAWVGQLASARVDPWTYPPVGLKTASLAVALHLKNPDPANHVFTKAEVNAAERHFEGCETFDAMEERNFNKIAAEGKNRTGFNNLVKAATALEADMKARQLGTFGTLMKSGVSLAGDLKQGDIEWLFIDEAQDLNAPQADFVAALQKQTGCRVFAIADDDQGIYKFRGASNRFLREFGKKTTTETFILTRNYRSTKPIVQACVQWITPNWTQLRNPIKNLKSTREGLRIVVLAASGKYGEQARGAHAKIILEACNDKKLLGSWGEAAVLDFSVNSEDGDLGASGLKVHKCGETRLDQKVLSSFFDLCRRRKAAGPWHHGLWEDFLSGCTAGQIPPLGHPGLDDLYAALEVIRRLRPDWDSSAAANAISGINGTRKDSQKHFFLGQRPEPDFQADKINYLTLHSSKGMEFRAVWLVGCGFAFSSKAWDEVEGQPNVQDVFDFIKGLLVGKTAAQKMEEANRLAAQLETRRLLYVGMSRATDLVMISAPHTAKIEKKWHPATRRDCEQNNAFRSALDIALDGVPHVIIRSTADARKFASTITAAHRHPDWNPPHRYRVESFTSLTRQSDENREVEIPRDREYPLPQSEEAMIGDLFHRIMHLLCLEPDLIQERLDNKITNAELIARVSTATGLNKLDGLLTSFFTDPQGPWNHIQSGNCKSEVAFSHVTEIPIATKNGTVPGRGPQPACPPDTRRTSGPLVPTARAIDETACEEILLKGFLDLVRFGNDGRPDLILDYKTGAAPAPGSPEDARHTEQLITYRNALCATYSLKPAQIKLADYYVAHQQLHPRG